MSLLSPRQAEVLYRLARGWSRKAIAADLGISVHTVDMYLARMRTRIDGTLLEFYLANMAAVDELAGCPED